MLDTCRYQSVCLGASCDQQYLAKNPNGYCGISGTGVSCPVGAR